MLTYTDRKDQTTTYTPRDALGRFAEVTYADGSTITADTYDNGNRLLEVHRLSKRRDLAQLRRPEPSDRGIQPAGDGAEPMRDAPWTFQFPDDGLYPVAVALMTWFNANGRVDSVYMYELTRGSAPHVVVLGLDLPADPTLAETLTTIAVAAGAGPDAFVVRFLPDEPSHCAGIAGIGLTPFYRRP